MQMPFDKEFLIRAGIRDGIRQLILENLLDDRHDLSGNSIYGLKFDMTVLAGTRTYSPAFVRVSVKIPTGFRSAIDNHAIDTNDFATNHDVPNYVKQYFLTSIRNMFYNADNPLNESYIFYLNWLSDIESRINSYESQIDAMDGPTAGCDLEKRRTRILKAVNDVLGIDNSSFYNNEETGLLGDYIRLNLPFPWHDYFRIDISFSSLVDCEINPTVSVKQILDSIYLFPERPSGSDYLALVEADGDTLVYVSTDDFKRGNFDTAKELLPSYRFIEEVALYVKNNKIKSDNITTVNVSDDNGKEFVGTFIRIPSGFFNFIENSMDKSDAYTYALFPKTEALGVIAEESFNVSGVVAAAFGNGDGQLGLASEESQQDFRAAPRQIGFIETRSTETLVFGWIIGGHDRLQSTHKSGLALVSLPAWIGEIDVHVETGWVSANGAMAPTKSYDFAVPVPPDYEAFDVLVSGSQANREPQIADVLMDDETVEACQDVSVIIPGLRLWRSTMVTLGGQLADRITVLPNMRGIVARFDNFRANAVPRESRNAKLRVWTSEGVDLAVADVRVSPPQAGAKCLADAVSQGFNAEGEKAAVSVGE